MLSFFGGKSKMGEWIYQFIPKDIDTYAEPFSGSFWVYFNTKLSYKHVKNIRYNDINRYTCNLFSCTKDYKKFLKVLEDSLDLGGYLYADKTDSVKYKEFYRNLYYDYKNNVSNTFLEDDSFEIPDYEVGMKYAFLITSSFNGCWPKAAGFSGVNDGRLKLNAFINKLKDKKYQDKLDGITSFETLDFEEFINKYDSEKTFFYCDPPYEDNKDNRLNWYGVKDDSKFGRLSHKRLADLLKQTKAKWALSYYYYDDLEKWFPKDQFTWITKEFFRSSASFSENKEIKGNELLILNYNPNHITSNTQQSEKLVDEIEEANDGGFIVSLADGDEVKISNLGRVVVDNNYILNQNITSEKREEILNTKFGPVDNYLKDIEEDKNLNISAVEIANDGKKSDVVDDKINDDVDDFWLT